MELRFRTQSPPWYRLTWNPDSDISGAHCSLPSLCQPCSDQCPTPSFGSGTYVGSISFNPLSSETERRAGAEPQSHPQQPWICRASTKLRAGHSLLSKKMLLIEAGCGQASRLSHSAAPPVVSSGPSASHCFSSHSLATNRPGQAPPQPAGPAPKLGNKWSPSINVRSCSNPVALEEPIVRKKYMD